ncbi:regulator of G-protein signaling [Acrasis kona]|uniref:Regulator of G-protein signaling n=1 Tax=Acrasis kona TaxID=1008807 RepID=A0AAW2Z228_9EUKA
MRDTWGIAKQLTLSIIVYVVFCVMFGITQSIPAFVRTGEKYIPAVWILLFPITFDHICNNLYPCIVAFELFQRPSSDQKEDAAPYIEDNILVTLEYDVTRKLFKEYAMKSFCVEDLICWEDIQLYKSLSSNRKRIEKAQEIIDRYLVENSPAELNLSNPIDILNDLRASIERMESSENDEEVHLHDEIFMKLEGCILSNMNDVYLRFVSHQREKRQPKPQ